MARPGSQSAEAPPRRPWRTRPPPPGPPSVPKWTRQTTSRCKCTAQWHRQQPSPLFPELCHFQTESHNGPRVVSGPRGRAEPSIRPRFTSLSSEKPCQPLLTRGLSLSRWYFSQLSCHVSTSRWWLVTLPRCCLCAREGGSVAFAHRKPGAPGTDVWL